MFWIEFPQSDYKYRDFYDNPPVSEVFSINIFIFASLLSNTYAHETFYQIPPSGRLANPDKPYARICTNPYGSRTNRAVFSAD